MKLFKEKTKTEEQAKEYNPLGESTRMIQVCNNCDLMMESCAYYSWLHCESHRENKEREYWIAFNDGIKYCPCCGKKLNDKN